MTDEQKPDEKKAQGAPGLLKAEETVGEMLIAARVRKGISLEVLSQDTKLPKQMLEYLETDNFEALPAKVYAKSFLRTYGEALDLDIQQLLSKYEIQTGQTHKSKGDHWEVESEVVEERLEPIRLFRRFVFPGIIVVAVVVMFAVIGRRHEKRVEPPKPVDIKEEILQPAERGGESQKPAAASPASSEIQPVDEPMELRIIAGAADSSWIELVTVSTYEGKQETASFGFLLSPSRSRVFQATDTFIFRKIGNAGGITLELNGIRLPAVGKRGRVRTDLRLTRDDIPSVPGER